MRIRNRGEFVEHWHEDDGVEDLERNEEDSKDDIGEKPVVLAKWTMDENKEKKRIEDAINNNRLKVHLNKIDEK